MNRQMDNVNLNSKTREITSVGMGVEEKERCCTVGGNANWGSHSGKQYGDSSEI